MERFSALPRGAQIMLVGAALLLVDTFLPWQSVSIEALGVRISESWTAWHGVWGVLLGLLTIALLVWLVLRLAGTEVALPVSDTLVTVALAALILLAAALKVLTDEAVAWGAWLGLVLAIVIAVGAWLELQAAGGLDTLRTEASTAGSGSGRSDPPPATTTGAEPMAASAPPSAPVTPATPPPASAAPPEPAAPAPPAEPVAPAQAGAPSVAEEPPAPAPPPPPDDPRTHEPRP